MCGGVLGCGVEFRRKSLSRGETKPDRGGPFPLSYDSIMASNAQQPIPVGPSLILSLTAATIAEMTTMPLDTAKVRLQLQSQAQGAQATVARAHYKGLVDCLGKMARQEGAASMWRGVTAGLQRQAVFAPIRIGLYEPVRNFYMGEEAVARGDLPTLGQKILAGWTTSAIGITVASPADLVKVFLCR